MKASTKLLISGVSALALMAIAGPASAADMQLKAAPAALPTMSWTGWYISGLVGVGTSSSICSNDVNTTYDYGCNGYSQTGYYGSSGIPVKSKPAALAGVEIGMDWQQRYFVYGVAADWTWTGLKGSNLGGSGSLSYKAKIEWLASFRGRMGLAVDNTMVYVTGGLALGGVKDTTFIGSPSYQHTVNDVRVGWVAGVGVEHRFSRNWSFKGEYLHYELGKETKSFTVSSVDFGLGFAHTVDVARIGLTYRP